MDAIVKKIIIGVLSVLAGILAGELKDNWSNGKENEKDDDL